MDRPEPARIESAEPSSPGPRRLTRLATTPVVQRLAAGRLARAVGLGLAAAALLFVGGSSVSRMLVAWLHRQPEYQLRFSDIATEPGVPAWIKGGRAALLEEIRGDRKSLETFSTLDINLEDLRTAFRLNPWIAGADRVVRAPTNEITVFVTFRAPVARVAAGKREWYALDREGKVLPYDQLDLSRIELPVTIASDLPATAPKPGLDWPTADPAPPGLKPWMARAAGLAGFLRDRIIAEKGDAHAPTRATIHPATPDPGFLVEFDGPLFVHWGRADDPDGPPDGEKWRLLMSEPRSLKSGEYLEFTPKGLELKRFKPSSRSSKSP